MLVGAEGLVGGADISVTTLVGDADVYVTVDGSRPT